MNAYTYTGLPVHFGHEADAKEFAQEESKAHHCTFHVYGNCGQWEPACPFKVFRQGERVTLPCCAYHCATFRDGERVEVMR